MIWIKLALRELLNNRRFSFFFVINLSLGLLGFVALDSFKQSLDQHLGANAKGILTADLSISAHRPFSIEELQVVDDIIGTDYVSSKQINFFAMAAGNESSRLVYVSAIDDIFPLYGDIILEKKAQDVESLNKSLGLWTYPETLSALGVKPGEEIHLGETHFKATGELVDDPGNIVSAFALAPKVYIGLSQVEKTELIQFGSRVSYLQFFRFNSPVEVEPLAKELIAAFETLHGVNPEIQVQTARDASGQLGRTLGYLNDYLGLIALIALFLAGLGSAYLFRTFLNGKFREIAVLMSLGAAKKDAYRVSLYQLMLLGTVSALCAVLLAFLMIPLLPVLLAGFLPKGFSAGINPLSIGLAFLMGTLGSVVFCLPVLNRIKFLKPVTLFNEEVIQSKAEKGSRMKSVLPYIPVVLIFWSLSVLQAHSFIIGSLFTLLFLVSALLLGLCSWFLLSFCSRKSLQKTVPLKIAFRNLSRNRLAAASCFLAIALGALLTSLIPQVQNGLKGEFSKPEDLKVPSFFLFDIQPEQSEELQKYVKDIGYELSQLSPIVRVRLDKINGESFETRQDEKTLTREQETERRFRNRAMNASFRAKLSEAETMTEGRELSPTYDLDSGKPADISLEKRFATRMGLKMGDLLTFDVQGIPIEGKVVNMRRVRWNSFQPNFFILFQPGVMEDAPMTYLAGITGVPLDEKNALQNGIVKKFPNVSMIDVSRVILKILNITDQMSWALRLMAYLSILAGLVVVFSIARNEAQTRYREINLLKVLGASFQDIRTIILIEFGVLGFFAAFFGVAVSVGVSYVISYMLFDAIWQASLLTGGLTVVAITLLSVAIALLATGKVLSQKPLSLLQST